MSRAEPESVRCHPRDTLAAMTQLADVDLDGIVARLRREFDPLVVFLYGSHVRGEATEGSDVDLLVVVEASDEPRHHRARRARRAVGYVGVPVDITVVTLDEFEKRSAWLSTVERAAREEGEVLYRGRGEGVVA